MHILFDEIQKPSGNKLGVITLNRPSALNALNHPMLNQLATQLHHWAKQDNIEAVLIKSNNNKAFCAGGDIKQVYADKQTRQPNLARFFWDEYRLNYFIHHFPKPYIALSNGITMGGGVGISLHGSHRIATEDFIFAMPEMRIGLTTDIGASYLLSRLPKPIGLYLALSGAQLNATQAKHLKLIDHVIANDAHENVIELVAQTNWHIADSFAELIAPYNHESKDNICWPKFISDCFNENSVAAILDALAQHPEPAAQNLRKALLACSPTSLAITFESLRRAENQSLAECLQTEYRLVCRCLADHDFFEGVRALLIDKDQNPQWQPAALSQITTQRIEHYFSPLPNEISFA